MKKVVFTTAIIFGIVFSACNNPGSSNVQTQKIDSTLTKTTGSMKNLISIVEIPATDFSRAVKFYETILGVSIEEVDMGGTQMGVIPGDENAVNVCIVKGSDYKPTTDGTVVYLNAGDDLQLTLNKIEPNGGKIIVPKTAISPEMGFFAMFTDTEGSKIGLHSIH